MKVVVIEIKTYQSKNTQIKSDTWKIQLTIAVNFVSSKDVDEERVMHLSTNNIEYMTYDNANEIVNELFE